MYIIKREGDLDLDERTFPEREKERERERDLSWGPTGCSMIFVLPHVRFDEESQIYIHIIYLCNEEIIYIYIYIYIYMIKIY